MAKQYETALDIGDRLRLVRVGKGLSPEEVASATGLSRAAIYRYEAGNPIRVDALGKIADFFDVSIASLFGVGSEFIGSAKEFFERMRQIEAVADQITALFGPVAFLLTTENFDSLLKQLLHESVPEAAPNQHSLDDEIAQILEILYQRKEAYLYRRPSIVSLVSALELEQMLVTGLVGKYGLPDDVVAQRREAAMIEAENVLRMMVDQPMGVQIGLVEDSLPGASFQILKNGPSSVVAMSPFRLGLYANIRVGVGTITSAHESVEMHQKVTSDLWHNSKKSEDAIQRVKDIIKQHTR
ncbi:Transcriptional regulator, contains XRE-family HTH domain [Cohaesibacter marisflavi]|uniref:Transcriptional regulator, contains XRE-family HTH domain n=1 Tax=Cohaesibacter marisflavi TaxID=655353 RepID=A0A1I5DGY0_9HYPH|nr:helix-turn-helix transcriptional regulator [Cohaesibacter marisflavi]SFN98488.1 Transcriptional regulator, contains XRE-family HTH domain [Cohaesibacter marisflavi]